MELLDILEQRVTDLLTEITALREENRRLHEDAAVARRHAEGMAELQQTLEHERGLREQALARVDALLRRIQEGLGQP